MIGNTNLARSLDRLTFILIAFELIVFCVAIFLQVRLQYGNQNNHVLKMVSWILWRTGFVLCGLMITMVIAMELARGRGGLKKGILIILSIIIAVGAVQGKAKLLQVFAAGGEREIIQKGHNMIGYYVKVRTRSPYHDVVTMESIYCEKDVYNELKISKSYTMFYLSNSYVDLGVLENYRELVR